MRAFENDQQDIIIVGKKSIFVLGGQAACARIDWAVNSIWTAASAVVKDIICVTMHD